MFVLGLQHNTTLQATLDKTRQDKTSQYDRWFVYFYEVLSKVTNSQRMNNTIVIDIAIAIAIAIARSFHVCNELS